MSKRTRWLTVEQVFSISPNMTRMVFIGEDLQDFPEGQESGYIKWCFSPELSLNSFSESFALSLGENFTPSPQALEESSKKPTVRSMTIRAFTKANVQSPARLIIDIVNRGKSGPASYWASTAKAGDHISVIGPGATKLAPCDANHYVFIGDLTAVPAIAVNLEKLPKSATGKVLIAVPSAEDCIHLHKPEGIDIHWIIEPEVTQIAGQLLKETRTLNLEPEGLYAWVAGEFETMRALRRFLRQTYKLDNSSLYASSYWKIGTNDEGNKAAKKQDSEA